MLRHFLIAAVKHNLCFCVLDYAGFQVIGYKNPRHTAEKAICVHMSRNPCLLLHAQKSFSVGIATVGKYRHKYICGKDFPSVGVRKLSGLPGPINFHELAGFAINVHGCLCLGNILPIVGFELGQLVWNFAGSPALVAVFKPKKLLGHTRLAHFPMDVLVIRHFIAGFAITLEE